MYLAHLLIVVLKFVFSIKILLLSATTSKTFITTFILKRLVNRNRFGPKDAPRHNSYLCERFRLSGKAGLA